MKKFLIIFAIHSAFLFSSFAQTDGTSKRTSLPSLDEIIMNAKREHKRGKHKFKVKQKKIKNDRSLCPETGKGVKVAIKIKDLNETDYYHNCDFGEIEVKKIAEGRIEVGGTIYDH